MYVKEISRLMMQEKNYGLFPEPEAGIAQSV
jgi:hypothetical protein